MIGLKNLSGKKRKVVRNLSIEEVKLQPQKDYSNV